MNHIPGGFMRLHIITLKKNPCLTTLLHCHCRSTFEKYISKLEYELDERNSE
ncbi:unnamed protein product, partial [Bubo scandiacus]